MSLFGLHKNHKNTSMESLGYWDIHNHILPGIDDGSSCVEESYDMLREEYRQGIRNIIFTPHYRPDMFRIKASVREHVFLQFVDEIQDHFPDMHFYLGCELYNHDGMLDALRDVRCRMAGTQAVLLEFSTSGHFRDMEKAVKQVIQEGFQPILAHVERYACLYADEERIYKLRDMGAFIQVNAGTVLEGRFSQRRKFAGALLDRQAVDFIASDAHDMEHRPVQLQECIHMLAKQYGMDTADRLFKKNPSRVFQKQLSYSSKIG